MLMKMMMMITTLKSVMELITIQLMTNRKILTKYDQNTKV
jgi:hypothetical protein